MKQLIHQFYTCKVKKTLYQGLELLKLLINRFLVTLTIIFTPDNQSEIYCLKQEQVSKVADKASKITATKETSFNPTNFHKFKCMKIKLNVIMH